jgi:hypothetical protein
VMLATHVRTILVLVAAYGSIYLYWVLYILYLCC